MGEFATSWPFIRAAAEAFRPPKRVKVADGAQQSLVIRQPGGYSGPWSPAETPYMVEPMNMLASRRHEAVCFVGPARTGKTLGLLDAWFSYAVTCDPGDMLIVQMSQEKAREFSKTRIDRAIRNSPALREMMSSRGNDDNTHDKLFKHGMWVKIGWPSASQLSSSDYRYVALTDYDRMPDDIDGEGSAYALALKRTQTFLSRGMGMVESSPGREIEDPHWLPITPHEAPPCSGILGIYNRSDRRRWYWQCPDCSEYFEAAPGMKLFSLLPSQDELLEVVRGANLPAFAQDHAKVVCHHCGSVIEPKWKSHLNDITRARWLADGQSITSDGEIFGESQVSNIAGYWLGCVAAAYQSWHSLVLRYLQGLREYALSGSELSLQSTVNTDQGMPYMRMALAAAARDNAGLNDRTEGLDRFIVPNEARFLAAAVDVQGGQNARFVVEVQAVGPHREKWVTDRYSITESNREGPDGKRLKIDPASYPEDWDVITEMLVKATYRLREDGKEMMIRRIAVDTGGEDGVTDKAYDWYRKIRASGYHGRVMLTKGASTKNAPLIRESWVGGKRKGEKGDIPLYLLNPNLLKDMVYSSYKRVKPGPGYLHIPAWLPKSWHDEMQAEVRQKDGTWKKVRARNETIDLNAMINAACIHLGADKIDWDNPPAWARPLSENSDVITREERRRMQADKPVAPVPRRVARSSYVR
jgi:phage terminase large subunit GpA-like protein